MGFELLPNDLILKIGKELQNPKEVINFAASCKFIYKSLTGKVDLSTSYVQETPPINLLQLLKTQKEEKKFQQAFQVANIFIKAGHLPPLFYRVTPLWQKIQSVDPAQINYFVENPSSTSILASYNSLSFKDIFSYPLNLDKAKTLCTELSRIMKVELSTDDLNDLVLIMDYIITSGNYRGYANFILQPTKHSTPLLEPLIIKLPPIANLYRVFEYAIYSPTFLEKLCNIYGNEPSSVLNIIAQLCELPDLELTKILKLKTFTLIPPQVVGILSVEQWKSIKTQYPDFEKALARIFSVTKKPFTFYIDEIPSPEDPNLYKEFITRYVEVIMDGYSQIRAREIAMSTSSLETNDMQISAPTTPSPP